MNQHQQGFGTIAVHAGGEPDPSTGAIMPPVYLTSTYVQEAPARTKGYEYSRTGNPTRKALERCVAALEGGRHGLAFASGMAAIDCVLRTLATGDHVVCSDDVYGGTHRLFRRVLERFGLAFTFVDATKPGALAGAVRKETKLLFLESPSNPLLKVIDLAAAAAEARHAAAGRPILVVVDNTFATPALQRPLELGADVVVHSTTKYLGGHSDVVGGAIAVNDDALAQNLAFLQNAIGAVPGPLDCFLVLRGIRTLHLRMERHSESALALARFLAAHAKVERVHYPGLEAHPGHAIARRQMRRPGGMISFELRSGLVEDAKLLVARTKLFALAESLGGVESLIEHPASMTHASIPPDVRRAAGFADGLVRISVGLEDAADLQRDLARALEGAAET